jgi:hypothetical protein
MKPSLHRPAFGAALLAIAFLTSCDHDSDDGPTSVRKWEVTLRAQYEVPAPAGRNEEGEATIELFSDNSLKYDFHIHNLTAGDALTNAHIHTGDAATSGPVLIPFSPTFNGAGSSGTVTGLRQGQVDTLLSMPVYVNVHSNQVAPGIVRAQLDKTVDFAADIALTGANEVPPVTTTATGMAILRLTTDKVLYSKVTVTNLENTDALTVAHIHPGAAGANNPPAVNLCTNVGDFGKVIISNPLTDAQVGQIKNDPMYVNAHSQQHGPGLVRGQIR